MLSDPPELQFDVVKIPQRGHNNKDGGGRYTLGPRGSQRSPEGLRRLGGQRLEPGGLGRARG